MFGTDITVKFIRKFCTFRKMDKMYVLIFVPIDIYLFIVAQAVDDFIPCNVLRYHWLMPLSCYLRDCKAVLVTYHSECPDLYF